MEVIVKYTTVTARSIEELDNSVNVLLAKNWRLRCRVFKGADPHAGIRIYCQTMVLIRP